MPSLPSELTDRIIALVSDDTTLLGCALVARSWIPASRSQSISKSDLLIQQHLSDKRSTIAELVRAPHSTLSRYLTSVTFSNHGYPGGQKNAEIFYDTCRAFIEARTPFRSLRFHGSFDPLWRKLMDCEIHTFIAMASTTLRSLAILNAYQTPISLDRAFFDSLAGCSVLEELAVPEDFACEVSTLDPAPRVVGLVALKTLKITCGFRESRMSESDTGGLCFLLTWLCQNTPPEGLEELQMTNNQDVNAILRCMESNVLYSNRVCCLDIRHPFNTQPIQVGTAFSQLHTAQFKLLVNSDEYTIPHLNDLFESLPALADSSKKLRMVSVFTDFGDDYTRPGLVETLRKADIDAALWRFANQSSHLDISLHTKFLPPDWEEKDMREFFPLCMAERSPFELECVEDGLEFGLYFGWGNGKINLWELRTVLY